MVERTLDAMYAGGLFDHIGFGFARYSTDRMWLVPHFEKMLYDNALLAYAYAEAYQATGHRRHREVAERVVEYVLRDMRDEGGGFIPRKTPIPKGKRGSFTFGRRTKCEACWERKSRGCFRRSITSRRKEILKAGAFQT